MASFTLYCKNQPFVVSVSDYDLERVLAAGPWYVLEGTHTNYVFRMLNKSRLQLHRFILDAPRELDVDHVNADGLDNRRCNLRLCSKTQNQGNCRKRRDNSSGYKGVCYRKNTGKYEANIKVKGRQKSLGSFDTAEEAAEAYRLAALQVFGEFARF